MQIKTKIGSSHTTDYTPVKQEVNGTVMLPPLVFLVAIIGSVNKGVKALNKTTNVAEAISYSNKFVQHAKCDGPLTVVTYSYRKNRLTNLSDCISQSC